MATRSTPRIDRRTFLRSAALVPFIATSAAASAPSGPGAAHPALKPALNAFSFLELLNANAKDPAAGLDLFGVCDFCAREGLGGVDVTGYFFPGYPEAPADAYLFRLKRHAHRLGLEITGTGVRNDFTAADRAVRDEGVARVKTWIEVAAKLGAPVLRVFADSQAPYRMWQEAAGGAARAEVEAWMAEAIRTCADHGAKHGILIGVQNHGDFIRSGAEHLALLERVNHEWCGAIVDTGKYLTDDPYADIALVAPRAVNWQIKETMGSTLASPRVDLKRLVEIIRTSGYRGHLPIETLAMGRKDYDPFREVKALVSALRAAIGSD